MGNVRPKYLVIDKSSQVLEAFLKVVNEDPYYWEKTLEGSSRQIEFHVILCWFEGMGR